MNSWPTYCFTGRYISCSWLKGIKLGYQLFYLCPIIRCFIIFGPTLSKVGESFDVTVLGHVRYQRVQGVLVNAICLMHRWPSPPAHRRSGNVSRYDVGFRNVLNERFHKPVLNKAYKDVLKTIKFIFFFRTSSKGWTLNSGTPKRWYLHYRNSAQGWRHMFQKKLRFIRL